MKMKCLNSSCKLCVQACVDDMVIFIDISFEYMDETKKSIHITRALHSKQLRHRECSRYLPFPLPRSTLITNI